jgi:putative toxin-antitoxin system antitoxin component (TIGR02293 family)
MANGKTKTEFKASKTGKSKTSDPRRESSIAVTAAYEKAPIEERGSSTVQEPATVAYITGKRQVTNGINNWVILHNASKKPESRMTSFEKINIIREGISKKDLEHLKEKTDLDYNQLSKVLSVARATLINKKGDARFDTVLSERIVGVADIYSYGYEVFEDESRFNEWIFRGNQSLGGQAPYDLLDNQYGREEVKNLIGRIDYGVYS